MNAKKGTQKSAERAMASGKKSKGSDRAAVPLEEVERNEEAEAVPRLELLVA